MIVELIYGQRRFPSILNYRRFYSKKNNSNHQSITLNHLSIPLLSFFSSENLWLEISQRLVQATPLYPCSLDGEVFRKIKNFISYFYFCMYFCFSGIFSCFKRIIFLYFIFYIHRYQDFTVFLYIKNCSSFFFCQGSSWVNIIIFLYIYPCNNSVFNPWRF